MDHTVLYLQLRQCLLLPRIGYAFTRWRLPSLR